MAKKNKRKKLLGFKLLELAKYINSNPEKQAKINTEHKLISNENKKLLLSFGSKNTAVSLTQRVG